MKKNSITKLSDDNELFPIDDIINEIGEENEDELQVDYLSNISNVVTWSTDWTVETIVSQIEKGNIDLKPPFQRRDAWNQSKKSRLIESLVYGLPVPQIVLAENKVNKGKFIIVDGKQRLLTLFQFCSEKSNSILKLSGLSNEILNGKNRLDFLSKNSELYNNFLNQSIRSVIIKNWPTETFLYTIFFRLNTGSLGLSPQELRLALHPGKFMDYVEEISQNEVIMKLLSITRPDPRMRDVDLLIRYFAFKNFSESYTGNLKNFLDTSCEKINSDWNSLQEIIIKQTNQLFDTINLSIDIFGEKNIFRKWSKGKFETKINRAIFDIMIFYFTNCDFQVLKENKKLIVDEFKNLCDKNPDFLKSISSNTNNMIETSTRFRLWGNILNQKLNFKLSIPKNMI